MKAYVGQTRSRKLIQQLAEEGIGECTVRGELPPRRIPWFLDNGAFRDWKKQKVFDSKQFLEDVEDIKQSLLPRPDFILLPDIVAGGFNSMKWSIDWLLHLVGDEGPFYFAVQDGLTPALIKPFIRKLDGIFIGGSLKWKLDTGAEWVRFAHTHTLPCHIGRVGTAQRVIWAKHIGADSIDSCLPLFSKENLGRFLRALKG